MMTMIMKILFLPKQHLTAAMMFANTATTALFSTRTADSIILQKDILEEDNKYLNIFKWMTIIRDRAYSNMKTLLKMLNFYNGHIWFLDFKFNG